MVAGIYSAGFNLLPETENAFEKMIARPQRVIDTGDFMTRTGSVGLYEIIHAIARKSFEILLGKHVTM